MGSQSHQSDRGQAPVPVQRNDEDTPQLHGEQKRDRPKCRPGSLAVPGRLAHCWVWGASIVPPLHSAPGFLQTCVQRSPRSFWPGSTESLGAACSLRSFWWLLCSSEARLGPESCSLGLPPAPPRSLTWPPLPLLLPKHPARLPVRSALCWLAGEHSSPLGSTPSTYTPGERLCVLKSELATPALVQRPEARWL